MIKTFTVLIDFQHEGINFEPGNTHRNHRISAEQVDEFCGLGWVSTDGGISDELVTDHFVVQPDDIKIHTTNR